MAMVGYKRIFNQLHCGYQAAQAKNIGWCVPIDWLQVKNTLVILFYCTIPDLLEKDILENYFEDKE